MKEVITKYEPDVLYFDSKLAATVNDARRPDMLAFYYNQAAVSWKKPVALTYKNQDLHVGEILIYIIIMIEELP